MARIRAAALLTGAALALTVPALAQKGGSAPPSQAAPAATLSPVQAVSALPEEIFGFRRAGPATDFEQRPGGAGLGAGQEYRGRLGTSDAVITVYVYSGGQTDLPEGPDSPAVQAQRQTMSREVEMVTRQRGNQFLGEAAGPDIMGHTGRIALRCSQFPVRAANGGRLDGYGCLGVVAGRFLKLRMTSSNPSVPVNQAALVAFGRTVAMAIGN